MGVELGAVRRRCRVHPELEQLPRGRGGPRRSGPAGASPAAPGCRRDGAGTASRCASRAAGVSPRTLARASATIVAAVVVSILASSSSGASPWRDSPCHGGEDAAAAPGGVRSAGQGDPMGVAARPVNSLEPARAAVARGDFDDALVALATCRVRRAWTTPSASSCWRPPPTGRATRRARWPPGRSCTPGASAAGDHVGAARGAAMVAMHLMMDTGLMAPVRVIGAGRSAVRRRVRPGCTGCSRWPAATSGSCAATSSRPGTGRRAPWRRATGTTWCRPPPSDASAGRGSGSCRARSTRASPPSRRSGRPHVRPGRRAHHRHGVVRAGVRHAGTGPVRARGRVDGRHGRVAPSRRPRRQHERTMPRPSGRAVAAAGRLRRGQGGGTAGLRRAAALDASRVRLAADRARHDPAAAGRSRGPEEAFRAATPVAGTPSRGGRCCGWRRATSRPRRR